MPSISASFYTKKIFQRDCCRIPHFLFSESQFREVKKFQPKFTQLRSTKTGIPKTRWSDSSGKLAAASRSTTFSLGDRKGAASEWIFQILSLDSAEHKQGVGSDSRETLWRLKAGLGGGLREGFRRRSPGTRKKSWSHHGVPGSARCSLWPPFASGRTSRVLELTGRTRAGHCPPLSFTQRTSPTRFSPAVLELCMSFPCGASPCPRPVGQSPSAFPLPEVSFCGLDVPQYLSFLRVYLPPVSVYQWVSLPPLRYKYQSHRGKVTELLQGRSRVA